MRQGGILALDLSLSTGWAYGHHGDKPLSGVWRLPSIADGEGRILAALLDEAADALTVHDPRLIICEAPLNLSAQTAMSTARLQFSLAATISLLGYRREVEVKEERVDTVRMATIGRARFGGRDNAKAAVMNWLRTEKGWDITNDNAADATLLWLWCTEFEANRRQKR